MFYLSNWHDEGSERGQIFRISQRRIESTWPGDVDVETDSILRSALLTRQRIRAKRNQKRNLVIEFFFWPADPQVSTYFQGVAGTREKMSVVVAVDGNVQDVGIVVKDLLGSITVMDILNLLASNKTD